MYTVYSTVCSTLCSTIHSDCYYTGITASQVGSYCFAGLLFQLQHLPLVLVHSLTWPPHLVMVCQRLMVGTSLITVCITLKCAEYMMFSTISITVMYMVYVQQTRHGDTDWRGVLCTALIPLCPTHFRAIPESVPSCKVPQSWIAELFP